MAEPVIFDTTRAVKLEIPNFQNEDEHGVFVGSKIAFVDCLDCIPKIKKLMDKVREDKSSQERGTGNWKVLQTWTKQEYFDNGRAEANEDCRHLKVLTTTCKKNQYGLVSMNLAEPFRRQLGVLAENGVEDLPSPIEVVQEAPNEGEE